MIAGGIPQPAIARSILHAGKPITDRTLRTKFRSEIDGGGAEANGEVVQTLFMRAKAGDVTAMIWWTKTRMGWRETVVNANFNLNADIQAGDEVSRRLLPELASGNPPAAIEHAVAEDADRSLVRLEVLESPRTNGANGHG